ncbi:MAG TPA: hypothetical protein VHB21_11710, partial [Minicystis sp.]|nr:hypothetical protein [Minicystis sp.]
RAPAVHLSDAVALLDVIVETPAYARTGPAPAAAAMATAPAAVDAPAPDTTSTTPAPIRNDVPEHETAAGDPYGDVASPSLATRGREAAAALAAAAIRLLTGSDDAFDAATSDADRGPGYGVIAGDGTGSDPTHDHGARLDGAPGGAGAHAATPKGLGGAGVDAFGDRSRRSHVIGGLATECDFPDGAPPSMERAVVVVVVAVRADGKASDAIVAYDPGYGFGAAARRCALGRRYTPARDHEGRPVASLTAPINVRFLR